MNTICPIAVLTIGVAVFLMSDSALADVDSERGKALYENHCGDCHDDNVHKRKERRVTSLDELRIWVDSMSAHTGDDWRTEDIDDVTFYLSFRLYRFDR